MGAPDGAWCDSNYCVAVMKVIALTESMVAAIELPERVDGQSRHHDGAGAGMQIGCGRIQFRRP
jgi:hypothetical protein